MNTKTRPPRRRAVVVGCNYAESGNIRLKGAVNDAHLFALSLVNLFEFHPKNIVLLTDQLPDDALLSPQDTHASAFTSLGGSQLPVRTHITLGLRWLVSGAQAGDVLVFYFAGHGLQVDNMAGWEGEGYDECILPMDCMHKDGEINAMTAVGIRNILMSVEEEVQMSVFLDCTGGQTMMDPAGTGKWKYIRGVKQKGIWPFLTDPTDKMERARYDSSIWTSEPMRLKEVRPRFVPGVEVSNSADLADRASCKADGLSSCKARGFLLVAAPFGEVAVEARLPSIGIRSVSSQGKLNAMAVIPSNKPIIHGAFTWSLVKAMSDCVISSVRVYGGDKSVTFNALHQAVVKNLKLLRNSQGLVKLNQKSDLTFFRPSGSGGNDLLFYPLNGKSSRLKFNVATEPSQLNRKDSNWLPRRKDFMTAWQAEAALAVYGVQSEKADLWRQQQLKFHQHWEASFKRTQSALHTSAPAPLQKSTPVKQQPSSQHGGTPSTIVGFTSAEHLMSPSET